MTSATLFPEVNIPHGAQVATLAGGCFWCLEPAFEALEGVYECYTGYAGGKEVRPTYEAVCSGLTGHVESVQIVFDPQRITFTALLDTFWRYIDPTDDEGQYVDRGPQYRTAIFYHNENQKKRAQRSLETLKASHKFDHPIVTQILPFTTFYPAEDYHQDFYKKSPQRYQAYKQGSGRPR